ncbi:MAG: DNA mismatch endonuclease Vsr [Ignavibacteriales bacterium]|nr:DNA mismatch endonuclease Vsr [Ignavibacteriales bacterium]MCF8316655.1 DNA mismatch endonuclease Vsr [Ignavibacteriales bacterium]MCF8438311.1 DNA mismatch endonuclease Vsr [Ignavibacteriales bacterium]
MSRIHSKDTKPEVILARTLFARGFRYKKNDTTVYGTPDLTFKRLKLAIFVDGEFWHGKDWEIQKNRLQSNIEYWIPKIERNIKRDNEVNKKLTDEGWTILRFWSKDIENNLLSCVLLIENKVRNLKMNISERISIETFGDKRFRIKIVEPESPREAVITHYMHNKKNRASRIYKKDAVEFAREILAYKYPEEEITLKSAENALQYGIFNLENIPFPSVENPHFEFIDLFAGIGGFRLAFQNLGGKCIYSSEWEKAAQKTYRSNFGEVPFGDITRQIIKDYIPENFDILCGGFPCQAFSIAGYRKGFTDTRGTLFFDIEQIIEKHRPRVVFLENVKNLVSHDKGKTFKIIREILEDKLGYKVFYDVLNSMTHANVPQNRERIFIVAFDPKRVKNYTNFRFPSKIELTKTIRDVLEHDKQEDKYYYSKNHPYYPELEASITKNDTVYQWRRIYVRENKSNVCPTLTANMGAGGHNVPLIKDDFGIRKLTPKECFAFQGFPVDKFILPPIADSKLYMQAGNSVTMPLIEKIGGEILRVL